MSEQPFEGVRVVELAQWVFVPVAGALLADWGAEVVHVEPTEGDPYRGLATQGIGAERGGINLSLALANRGKRSLALDIRQEEGLAVLHRLLESADVFLTNMRPRALQRAGLDSDELTRRYPGLVYARGHGYGVRGPDADQAGYDATAFWARGGMAHILTPPERDYPIGQRGAMGDRNGALALAFGVAAALLKRTRSGTGSVVDVSLLSTAMWTLSSDLLAALVGNEPTASSGRGPLVNPLVGVYRTKDARHIQLVFLQPDRYWADFCRVIGRPDLVEDPRFVDLTARRENASACVAELDLEFAKRTFDEWKTALAESRRAMGSRPVRLGAARRPAGGGQRVHRRGGDRRRDRLPPAGRAGAARRQVPTTATRPGARRGHGSPLARGGLRLGGDHRPQRGGGRPVTETSRPVPVPDERSREFWAAAAEHSLVLARCAAMRYVQSSSRRGVPPLRFERSGL